MKPVVSLWSDLVYRYHCLSCDRLGAVYFIEATARHDADKHDCGKPAHNEKTAAEWQRLTRPVA